MNLKSFEIKPVCMSLLSCKHPKQLLVRELSFGVLHGRKALLWINPIPGKALKSLMIQHPLTKGDSSCEEGCSTKGGYKHYLKLQASHAVVAQVSEAVQKKLTPLTNFSF